MSAAANVTTTSPFKIEIIQGPHAGKKFVLNKSLVTIGRGPENDIVLSEDPKVSRLHAEIKFSSKGVTITNLSQKNFIVYRGQKVHTETVNFGEKIYIGDSELHFLMPESMRSADLGSSTVVALRPQPMVKQAQPIPTPVRSLFPPAGPPGTPPHQGAGFPQQKAPSPKSSGRLRFYLIVGAVALLLYLFLSSGSKKKLETIKFGPSETIQRELLQADETKRTYEEEKRKSETLQARRARENFTKGFRDYMQGQYARAKETFQVVLTLDPNHIEGRRYLTLSKLKFDQQVKNYMQQGRINFENKNYRLCKSHFLNAMTMLNQQTNDPTFQEAKKLYELCDLAQGSH